jgi:hypothetical protein
VIEKARKQVGGKNFITLDFSGSKTVMKDKSSDESMSRRSNEPIETISLSKSSLIRSEVRNLNI